MKSRFWVLAAVLLLIAVACEGGGSVSGMRGTCRSIGDSGSCDGGYNRLSGVYRQRLDLDFYQSGDAVQVDATVTVESGRVRISITAPDGTLTSAEAVSGSPASISGLGTAARGAAGTTYLSITYEAIDGEVSGLAYAIEFGRP